jgi:uroporphyrin-III C-methyltransferase
MNHASGFVSLVGAGPGHPDLLTVRGLKRIQAADVILPDALLHPDFAALYPAAALVIPAGKRCGRPSTPQERIHELMIGHARRGARVVRLKNGDPLLFGRGHEEAQALAAAGVPFELVPGVSALQAGAAAAGLSLTHRGLADEVRILEGHHLLDRPRDWGELAAPGPTLALFMATRALPAIARRLLAAGAPPELPVVLVEDAGGPLETVTRSVLAHAAAGLLQARTEGPGIVYLGPAAGLRTVAHAYPEPAPEDAPLSRPERLPRAAGGRRPDR